MKSSRPCFDSHLSKLFIIIGILSTSYGFSKSSDFQISYYEDPTAQLEVADVYQKFKQGEFISLGERQVNPGFTTSYYWIAVAQNGNSQNEGKNPHLVINNPHINRLDWYAIANGKATLINQTGDYTPYATRMVDYFDFAFPLLPQDSLYLLKIDKRYETLQFSASVVDLVEIQQTDVQKNLFYGVFCGAIVVILLFATFIYFSTGNSIYLVFSVHVLMQMLWLLSDKGFGTRYFWPDFIYFAARSRMFLTLLGIAASLEFLKRFINLDKALLPRKTITAFQLVAAFSALITLSPFPSESNPSIIYILAAIAVALWGLVFIVVPVIVLLQWRAGIKEAKIYALSHIPVIVLGMFINFQMAGLLQVPEFLIQYGLPFGHFFTILILLFGITFVFNEYKSQNLILLSEINNQQKKLTQRVLEAQESERKAIAQKIHDEVSAKLSVSMLHLSTINPLRPDMVKDINTIYAGLNDVRTTLRDISHQLMPMDLEKYGLKRSLESFFNSINQSKKMNVEYVIEGFDKVEETSTAFKSFVYRTLLECTNNIIKHSSASHVFFQLLEIKSNLTIVIEDNGVGFDNSKKNDGYGLSLIKAQTNHYEGKMEVHSRPNEGTTIIIELPIN